MTTSELHKRIDEIAHDCRNPKWDSYHADAVRQSTVELAHAIASHLPHRKEPWCVVATVNGGIEFQSGDDSVECV